MKKKLLTLANFLTVVSITCGVIAYHKWTGFMGDASLVTGMAAFIVGI